MKLEAILFLSYVLLPFLAIFMPWSQQFNKNWLSLGALLSILRIIIISFLGNSVIGGGGRLEIHGSLVSGYPLDVVLSLDARRFGFLLVAEICFLFSHWMCTVVGRPSLIRRLTCITQGITALFVLSDNAVAAGGFIILGGVSLYYLVRFSAEDLNDDLHALIAKQIHILSYTLGALFVSWGIMEFASREMLFAKGSANRWGSSLWILMLVLSVPVSPLSQWLRKSMRRVPEGVALCVIIFFSALLLKHSTIFGIVYPELTSGERSVIYGFGLLGAVVSLFLVFLSTTRRDMLGSLVSFFFSLVLVSLGVSKRASVDAAYYVCVFVPALSALILYGTSVQIRANLQKVFMAILCVLVLGLPGTPTYLIFSNIGARTLDLGVAHILMFGILWFLYFCSSVYIGRRLFLDDEKLDAGCVSALETAQAPIAAFGVVFMFFLILISQLSWRVL